MPGRCGGPTPADPGLGGPDLRGGLLVERRPARSRRATSPAALGRLAIFASVAAAVIACGSVSSRLSQNSSAVEQPGGTYGGEAVANDRQLPTCDIPSGHAPVCLERLRTFLFSGESSPLPPGEEQGVRAKESRLARFAAIACLVLALMGCSIGWRRWPMFWPTYAIALAVALADMFGVIPAGSRLPLEPIALVWAALAIAPPLVRLLPGRNVRVYRPGERGEDPLDSRHLLRGPHYNVSVRRRAG